MQLVTYMERKKKEEAKERNFRRNVEHVMTNEHFDQSSSSLFFPLDELLSVLKSNIYSVHSEYRTE